MTVDNILDKTKIVTFSDDDIEGSYKRQRMAQLKETEDFDSLLDRVVAYELELLDYADRLLSDDGLAMDSETAQETLRLVGSEATETLRLVDRDNSYKGLVMI